jgi:hypothetical protein
MLTRNFVKKNFDVLFYRERVTRVSDLESDYYNLENNPYLTAEERETIIARKEELRQMRVKREKTLVIDLDLTTGTAKESVDLSVG